MTDRIRAERDALAKDLADAMERIGQLEDDRDFWRGKAQKNHLLLKSMWLKGRDGEPVHLGDEVWGEDGTKWIVKGFRWGSSHPVQAVDGEGRRRDLKPSWLTHYEPDSIAKIAKELRDKGDGAIMTRQDWESLAERLEELA